MDMSDIQMEQSSFLAEKFVIQMGFEIIFLYLHLLKQCGVILIIPLP